MEGAQQIEKRKGFLICLSGPGCALDQSRGRAFAGVRECLEQLCRVADVVELTATSTRAAQRVELPRPAAALRGAGRKKAGRRGLPGRAAGPGYDRRKTLYVGCGPRDLAAAQTMGCCFTPFCPDARRPAGRSWAKRRCRNYCMEFLQDPTSKGCWPGTIPLCKTMGGE